MQESTLALMQTQKDEKIVQTKELRVKIQELINFLDSSLFASQETSLSRQRLKEARHWLGEELSRIGTPTPYPEADNPSNTIVAPTADLPPQ